MLEHFEFPFSSTDRPWSGIFIISLEKYTKTWKKSRWGHFFYSPLVKQSDKKLVQTIINAMTWMSMAREA